MQWKSLSTTANLAPGEKWRSHPKSLRRASPPTIPVYGTCKPCLKADIMNSTLHMEKALRIERSLKKLPAGLYEIRLDAAMLAATHWLNAALHWSGATDESEDVLHTYMLSINTFR